METKIKSLFISYLENSISKEDEDYLLQWIKNNPDSRQDLINFRHLWNMAGVVGESNPDFLERKFNLFLKRADSISTVQRRPKKVFWNWFQRVAAIFILGATVSLAISYSVFNSKNNELVFQEIIVPAGARSEITLPDGSKIWLNASSSLKYSNQFGKKQREIFLTGEAFFQVTKNKSKLFVVQTSDLSIKAYGTSFNVKSYPDENTVETTLVEGSIGVKRTGLGNSKKDEVILEPSQRVVYYKKTMNNEVKTDTGGEKTTEEKVLKTESQKLTYMISKGIDPEPFTKWKEGVVVIASKDLDELAVILERKYDVKIRFEDEMLKKLKLTGSLENETVEQVIEAIGIAANIDYQIEDRNILFKQKINK